MKFPLTVKHRRAEVTIYAKRPNYQFYRVAWRANGKRLVRSLASFPEARAFAESKAKEISQGNQSAALSAVQAADALTALQRLDTLRREHGRTATLSRAVSDYSEAIARLPEGRTLAEAVEGWLSGVATVKPHDLAGAVQEYLAALEIRTVSKEGRRPERSPKYFRHVRATLEKFQACNPGHQVADLTKGHLDLFVKSLSELAPKTRNHARATLRQFLG